MANHKKPNNCICKTCGVSFKTNSAYLKRGGGKYCSYDCMWKDKRSNPTTYTDSGGYLVTRRKRVHRTIMEDFLGRKLERKEHVHHINGNKQDNRVENLILLSESEHHKLHPTRGDNITKVCIVCGNTFCTVKSDYKFRSFCSLLCYWKRKKGTHPNYKFYAAKNGTTS